MTRPPMQPPRKSSHTDRAYSAILELIVNGELGRVDSISHRQLAQRLGMSKQPVAMALDRLEQDGIVESAARVGTRLTLGASCGSAQRGGGNGLP